MTPELHIILVKDISGKPTEADLDLDVAQLEELSRSEQALTLLEAYDSCKNALENQAIDDACLAIRNIIPMPKQDIPIQ